MNYQALGRRIRMQRRLNGMTQEQMSERADISLSFYGHIERGTRKPSLETLVIIANVLGVSTDMLLQDSLREDRLPCPQNFSESQRELLNEIANVISEFQK